MQSIQKYGLQVSIALVLVLVIYVLFIQASFTEPSLTPTPEQKVMTQSKIGKLIQSKGVLGMGIAQKILFKGTEYDALIINLEEANIQLYYKKSSGKRFENFGNLKNYLQNKGQQLIFATNAGIFEPGFQPEGLYVENGVELRPLNLKKGKGNFYLQPNGVFFLTNYKTANIISSEQYPNVKKVVKFATQSGPLLVMDGKINPQFSAKSKSRYIRNGVGLIHKNQIVILISNQAVSLHEFARVFKEFYQCPKALYLDGAISEMYLPVFKRYESKGNFGAMIGIVK